VSSTTSRESSKNLIHKLHAAAPKRKDSFPKSPGRKPLSSLATLPEENADMALAQERRWKEDGKRVLESQKARLVSQMAPDRQLRESTREAHDRDSKGKGKGRENSAAPTESARPKESEQRHEMDDMDENVENIMPIHRATSKSSLHMPKTGNCSLPKVDSPGG
jgi:hypothetical protein